MYGFDGRGHGEVYENMFNDLVDAGYLDKKAANSEYIFNWVNQVSKKEPLLLDFTQEDNIVEWLLSH